MFNFMVHTNEATIQDAAHSAALQFIQQGTTDFDSHIAAIEFLNQSAIEVSSDDGFNINDFSIMEA